MILQYIMMRCEKALGRANTISTELAKQKWRYALLCQCPVSGYSHFYFVGHVIDVDVSIGVNALSRAIPISTLPF